MTGYLVAAIVCRVVALAAVVAAVWLAFTGSPWWALLTGYTAFLAVFLGGRCHAGHLHPDTQRERTRT
jgi:hypothetical protein